MDLDSDVYQLIPIDTRARQIRLLDLEPGGFGGKLRGALRPAFLPVSKRLDSTGNDPGQQRMLGFLGKRPPDQYPSHSTLLRPVTPETKYEALSYTWGASKLERTITLNGKHMLGITDNLYNALRRLRKRVGIRTLWVRLSGPYPPFPSETFN
jgi:hypothetical protein